MMRVNKIPNKITQITAIVDRIEALKLCMLPAINMVLMVIKKGNLPITWNKIVG